MEKLVSKILNIKLILLLFVLVSIVYFDLPGLYMDAVNPDYVLEHIMHINNVPAWIFSDNVIASAFGNPWGLPLLNSLYGTNFTAYCSLPIVAILGNGIYTVRICHLLFAVLMLLSAYYFIKTATQNTKSASLICLLIALEPSIVFAQRTQYYLQLFPLIFSFVGIALITRQLTSNHIEFWKFIGAFVLLGLAACSYFIFAGYFVAVFIVVLVYVLKNKKDKKIPFLAILGFIVGYLPFIYAHLSILMQSGVAGYLQIIKGLDTYGISEGQTGLIGRIQDFFHESSRLFSGEAIIHTITGKGVFSNVFTFIFYAFGVACISISIIIALSKRKLFSSYGSRYAIIILDSCIFMHFAIALVVGSSLGYQHYVMLIPIIYLASSLLIFEFLKNSFSYNRRSIIMKLLPLIVEAIIICDVVNISAGYHNIGKTGGTGYYSEAINDIGEYLKSNSDENDVIICPQWGYWMGIAVITDGQRAIWNDSNIEAIKNRISQSRHKRYFIVDDNVTNDELIDEIIKSTEKKLTLEIPFSDRSGGILDIKLLLVE